MNEYTAKVTKDGRFWLISIDEIGMTQARTEAEIEPMARDLIACVLDLDDPNTISLEITHLG